MEIKENYCGLRAGTNKNRFIDFDEELTKGWSYDAPPKAMLHLTNPPEMKVIIPFTDYLLGRGGAKRT